jgi:uncharacterized repeat protein (TIGR03803 family)
MKSSRSTHEFKGAFIRRSALVIVIAMFVLMTAVHPITLHAQTFTDMHDFNCDRDGCDANFAGIVAQGTDGNLYGTTPAGGAGCGSVFRITPSGAFNDIYNFSGVDGCNPFGGLTLGTDGELYGTTETGGANDLGTIFKTTSSGGLTTLHSFTSAEGGYPYSPPVQGKQGFYGVTAEGTAYSITSTGTFKLFKHKLPGPSYAPLFLASNGSFYGTTSIGGSHNYGTVFRLTAGGAVTTIYNFDYTHGASPYQPLVQSADKNLYGMTYEGGSAQSPGGEVFKMTLAGEITVLHSFDQDSVSDGSFPTDGLVAAADGNFYGTTLVAPNGGSGFYGTIFRIDTKGDYSVLHDFDATHGQSPASTPMQLTNGTIYGTTDSGGASDDGVFWELNDGISPFVSIVGIPSGAPNTIVEILGQDFTTTSSVKFGSVAANFTVYSDSYLTAVVPNAAKTAAITVTTSKGAFISRQKFKVTH